MGTFISQVPRWEFFKNKILIADPDAVIDEKYPLYARHSVCRGYLKLREPYHAYSFEKHCETCTTVTPSTSLPTNHTGKKRKSKCLSGAGMKPLSTFLGFQADPAPAPGKGNLEAETTDLPSSSSNPVATKPFVPTCPGLQEHFIAGID